MYLTQFLSDRSVTYEENVSLSEKTWIKTGGTCACWITPTSVEQLAEVCRFLYKNEIEFDLVGQTSNIFFHSTYNPQVVVSTVKVSNYTINDSIIICDCGVSVIKLAKDCLSKGYAGFYGLVGLPGTVASAVFNNAGCFNCSISSMLMSADVLTPDGSIQTFQKEDFQYTHRSSAFKRRDRRGVILSVKLKTEKAKDIKEEYRKSEEAKNYRKNKQEGYKLNLGSIFSTRKRKNNLKNLIAAIITKVASASHITNHKRTNKQMLLWLYGYTDLNHYISDKQINTFVWCDTNAEQKFPRYKEFMSKVFDNLTIEIEEKQ